MKSQVEPLPATSDPAFDFHSVFNERYPSVVRVISRLVQDRGRSEDIAMEVFWKLWRTASAQGENVNGWLYRAAVRMALDELRRKKRRERYEKLFFISRPLPDPEQLHSIEERQNHVRVVLSLMKSRDAELLILRSEGLSYLELAQVTGLNSGSVRTLLRRAQQTFRKEFVKRYGET